MKIVINGKQVWPTDESPKQFAFRSELDPEDLTVVYTEYALDSGGSPTGNPTVRIEMHPKQVQSICFSAQNLGNQNNQNNQKDERSTTKIQQIADSVLRKIDETQQVRSGADSDPRA